MVNVIPVIPETITVHLGLPNTAAENVTVSFPDYVKNVASSEIYPTWDESALRANILAIMSYALNRVYTEFYRSRGYDFDITNTTARDQAFVNGRSYFENISRLVDEMIGKNVDKFADFKHVQRSHNGLLFLDKYANAYISCRVIDKVDLQTHIMFICDVTECVRLSDKETMTYTYYQKNVKPKPDTGKKGFVCKVCGYVYEGDELPADFICPLCKHGAADFEPIQ